MQLLQTKDGRSTLIPLILMGCHAFCSLICVICMVSPVKVCGGCLTIIIEGSEIYETDGEAAAKLFSDNYDTKNEDVCKAYTKCFSSEMNVFALSKRFTNYKEIEGKAMADTATDILFYSSLASTIVVGVGCLAGIAGLVLILLNLFKVTVPVVAIDLTLQYILIIPFIPMTIFLAASDINTTVANWIAFSVFLVASSVVGTVATVFTGNLGRAPVPKIAPPMGVQAQAPVVNIIWEPPGEQAMVDVPKEPNKTVKSIQKDLVKDEKSAKSVSKSEVKGKSSPFGGKSVEKLFPKAVKNEPKSAKSQELKGKSSTASGKAVEISIPKAESKSGKSQSSPAGTSSSTPTKNKSKS